MSNIFKIKKVAGDVIKVIEMHCVFLLGFYIIALSIDRDLIGLET